MKSVGEVMAVGRNFAESIQKALRGLETGLTGFDEVEIPGAEDEDPAAVRGAVIRALGMPTPDRLRVIAQAFRHGLTVEEIEAACSYEPWFLRQIEEIVRVEARVRREGLPEAEGGAEFRKLKSLGFSDARLAQLVGRPEADVRAARRALGVRPVFKRIDTVAAEFAADTAYMYSTYETGALGQLRKDEAPAQRPAQGHDPRHGAEPHRPGHRVRLLLLPRGLRPERARHRVDHGELQPETVSTDYDTSDRSISSRSPPRTCWRSSTSSAPGRVPGRHRPVRRPDPAEALPGAGGRGHPHPRHHPDAIDLAETASASPSCCAPSA
jgi:carbamoyl-phosphate synthase large subunit